jgi:flavin reductase (DIM6/NTAB) family NADH-FMN oxidoreductase RutF
VCLERSSVTLDALRIHGAFAVNVLAAGQHELWANFARSGGLASWQGVAFEPGGHEPLLHWRGSYARLAAA